MAANKQSFYNLTRSISLASDVTVANTFFLRLAGLIFSKPLIKGEGLLLEPCQCIHMLFMTFAIDAIFLDSTGRVVGVVENIGPWQVSGFYPGAKSCLELPAGTLTATCTQLGDIIEIQDSMSVK